jgi:hypothetical protein
MGNFGDSPGVALGGSVKADLAAHGFDELRGIVADSVLEDDVNLFDVFNVGRGVSLQHHDTMSAALPGAIVPILSSSPRNSAPFEVAM